MPGHVREAFLEAIEAYHGWRCYGRQKGETLPNVTFEVRYEPTQISLTTACGLVWGCTDQLPRIEVDWLVEDLELPMRSGTYAAAARAMLADIKALASQA